LPVKFPLLIWIKFLLIFSDLMSSAGFLLGIQPISVLRFRIIILY
jgi:hypothetical protein